MKNKLLVLTREQDRALTIFESFNLKDLEIYAPQSDQEIEKLVGEVNIIYGIPALAKHYLSQAKKLQWLQSSFTGVDALICPDLRQDYVLTNIKSAFSAVIAEYVFAYILMFEKEIFANHQLQLSKQWGQKPYLPLKARTIGIFGTGAIGQEIARVAKTFNMKVIGLRASNNRSVENFDQIYLHDQIDDLLSEADFVVSALPSTDLTRSSINSDVFSKMKDTAVFINVGRGDAVCEEDLIKALNHKQIKAAVLDVFCEEPLPADSPLWSTDHLYVTPHISGYIDSRYDDSYQTFQENYQRFVSGQELLNIVDFQKGY